MKKCVFCETETDGRYKSVPICPACFWLGRHKILNHQKAQRIGFIIALILISIVITGMMIVAFS